MNGDKNRFGGSNNFDFGGRTMSTNSFKYVPIYRKIHVSESDIQHNNLLYKIHQKYTNTFETLETWKSSNKIKHFKCLFYYVYKLHNSYFVLFVIFVYFIYFVFLYRYISDLLMYPLYWYIYVIFTINIFL